MNDNEPDNPKADVAGVLVLAFLVVVIWVLVGAAF